MRQSTPLGPAYKIAGIDVSKARLDMHWLADGTDHGFSNDDDGHRQLLAWLKRHQPDRVAFEATGAYHRALEKALKSEGVAYAKLNPWQVRRFADALGQHAKTDRLDAAHLARYAALLQPEATRPKSQALDDLAELRRARQALVKDQTAALNRQKTLTLSTLKDQGERRLQQIAQDIADSDGACRALIKSETRLACDFDILTSIPGIGAVSAIAMLAELPELGTLNAKQLASLAGLAPYTRQSGQWKGHSFIGKGRANIKRGLYMPTLVAITHNPVFRETYRRLTDAGKPAKVAIIAAMRKILITANALIRDQRKWALERP